VADKSELSTTERGSTYGFGTIESAARFCCAFDELRNYFRSRRTMGETVSLLEQRQAFLLRFTALQTLIQTAS